MTVLVVGAAVSGRAATRLLHDLGEKVVLYDLDPSAVRGTEADSVLTGDWEASYLEGIELVVTSPGVPEHAPPLVAALEASLPVWSELELGFRNCKAPVLAVTGTNGKTTVTEVATAMLVASGLRAAAAGNIGDPLSALVGGEHEVLVVEASSFQLRFVDTFHAPVAVLLNAAPDHLDWHGSVERYFAAKRRILERQDGDDIVVYDADDAGAVAVVREATARRVPVSGVRLPEGGWGVDGGMLLAPGVEIPVEDLARTDAAFLVDLAAAATAALAIGAHPAGVEAAARAYRPGRHRRQVVAMLRGVAWVDDSKATNPHAALAAIDAYESVVLIAGGRAKGLDLSLLPKRPNLRGVVAIGEAADDLAAAGEGVVIASDMDEAVAIAKAIAQPGDTVLLAPGCASFDMFSSYADRGDRFATAVASLEDS